MPIIVTGAVSALSGIATSINSISDTQKRRLFEQNLASLSFDQKLALNKMVTEAGSEDARQAILQQTLGNLGGARIGALSQVQVEKEKTKKTLWIIGGVIAALAVIGIVVTSKRKK